MASGGSERKRWLVILAVGLAVRVLFLFGAQPLDLHADESSYVYLAVLWNRLGFYGSGAHYVWPPGYAWFLSWFLQWFEAQGLTAVKLAQVLLSAVIGSCVLVLAKAAFDWRAARLAGWLWAGYLPLIGFSHYLWPETLFLAVFLPAVVLLVRLRTIELRRRAVHWHLLAAGGLLGVAILIKESALLLAALAPALLLRSASACSGLQRIQQGSMLLLAAAVVVVPWTLRNAEVYGRTVPVGATLGQNLFLGCNGRYQNFDYPRTDYEELYDSNDLVYRAFVAPPALAFWERSRVANVIDRSSANVQSARSFASEHPGYVLRSRWKKLADWWTPLSFFVRHHYLGLYHGVLAVDAVRTISVLVAVLSAMLVFFAAWGGFAVIADPRLRGVILWYGLGFLVTFPVVSMSRYRTPVEPLLLVLAAGFFGRWRTVLQLRWSTRLGLAAGWLLLGLLWLTNSREVLRVLRDVL